jgi:hypothetical protein
MPAPGVVEKASFSIPFKAADASYRTNKISTKSHN